jgi:ergothioneine biosynthesis protein EgtB
LLRPDAIWDRPIPERHRIIFYLGHFEAFDWNLICGDTLGFPSHNPEFDRLFAFGIDPVDGRLPSDQPTDWPPLDNIRRYNTRLRQDVDRSLANADFTGRVEYLHDGWAFNIAIEHRLMHAETLAYMFHWLPLDRKTAQSSGPQPQPPAGKPRMVEIPEGAATLGLPRSTQGTVGWDNEYERHSVEVPGFSIESLKVTNGEFLEFVRSGGYQDRALWGDAGWDWIQARHMQYPLFWLDCGDHWCYRSMFESIPIPLSWPVYVSHAEATAYARWKGMSLPTEPQFHRAAYGTPEITERSYPWGEEPPGLQHGNFDFHGWDGVPVGAFPAGTSAFGVADLVGNGWEWTSTPFAPFAGFEVLPFYQGYSADFFDGRHYVLKGGSQRTAAPLLRRSFRNWFQPHYPYIYSGFRCVAA